MSRATELFDITTRLAIGNAGLVYKAVDRATGRNVALKLLMQDDLIEHPLDVGALLRDAPELSRITGVNIVQLLDAFPDEDGTVLVYELAEGTRGLDVPGTCPIPAVHAVDVAAQLLAALRSGERQRYPHGGLKPSDVSLVALPDGRPLVMVLDWGLANYRVEPTPEALPYTAPERLAGEGPSHAADLFSAGATLVYLLTGRQLVAGTTKEDFAAAWQSMTLSGLGALRQDLPAALVKWLVRLLQPKPSQRPPTAVEALAALAALSPPLPPAVPEIIRPRPARPPPQPAPLPPQSQPRPPTLTRSFAAQNTASAQPTASGRPSADEVRKELARLQKITHSRRVLTTCLMFVLTLGIGGFAVWKYAQPGDPPPTASVQGASAPAPSPASVAAASIPEPSDTPAKAVAVIEAPAKPIAPPPPAAANAPSDTAAQFSSSPNPPAVEPTDVANLAAQSGTDKWFFASGDERYGADAAKGVTFTTGETPVFLKAVTYKIAEGNKKGATPANPTKWVVRVGTVNGNNFRGMATEQVQQTTDTGAGEYLTWRFSKPVLLAAKTTYGVDVAMQSGTTWQTGIPYLALSAKSSNKSIGQPYSSGDRGVGNSNIAPMGRFDRIFHLDLQAQ